MGVATRMRTAAAGVSGDAPAEELFPGYSVGRQWELDLASADADFTLSNMTRGTDPVTGLPAVYQTAPGTLGTVLTAVSDLQHVRIEVKLRPAPQDPFAISNVNAQLVARHADLDNEWRAAERKWSSGQLQGFSVVASNAAGETYDSGLDITDETTLRWIAADMVEDEIIRAQEWVDGASEPTWLTGADTVGRSKRIGGLTGIASSDSDSDNQEIGKAGIRLRFGGYIHYLRITELVKTSTSAMNNLGLDFRKTTHEPYFWLRSSDPNDATNGLYVVSATAHDGQTRKLLQAKKDLNPAQSPLWEQYFFLDDPAANFAFTREHPHVALATIPDFIRVRGWSKGTNVANSSGAGPSNRLSARSVLYYFSLVGALLMNTEGATNDYHVPFGPSNGEGTWDWWEFDHTYPIHSNESVVSLRLSHGLHDETVTADELLFEITSVEPA